MHVECTCGVTHAVAVAVYTYGLGVCNLCYAFCNSPRPQCSVLELAFSKAEIRSFSKANSRLSATWNTSPFDLLFTVTLFLVWFHLYCAEGLHFSAFILYRFDLKYTDMQ